VPLLDEGGSEFYSETPKRIVDVERASYGTLPSTMVLSLAQSGWSDLDLTRASKLLARRFDMDPSSLFEPYQIPGRAPLSSVYTDPVTGGPLSFESARRLMGIIEPRIVKKMLRGAVRTHVAYGPRGPVGLGDDVDPNRVSRVLKAFAPVTGTEFPLIAAMGAAVTIARSDVDLKLFRANLEFTSKLPGLDTPAQIAAAHQAAARGQQVRTLADVATALAPNLEDLLARHEGKILGLVEPGPGPKRRERTETVSPQIAAQRAATEIAREGARTQQVSLGTLAAEAEFADVVTAGLADPGDWLSVLEDAQSDYVAAAKELEDRIALPFGDTVVGRGLVGVLDAISRPVGALERIVFALPISLVREIADPNYVFEEGGREALKDSWDILRGRTNVYAEFAKEGVPLWATALVDLAIGAKFDPLMWTLKWRSGVRASLLITNTAATGRAADTIADVTRFLDQRVRRIGDLRELTIAQYLTREALRARNPGTYFDRAVNNFRRYFGAGSGIDYKTAASIFEYARSSRKLGVGVPKIEAAVRELLGAAMMVPPSFGSFAEDIAELDRVARASRTDAIVAEISERVGATGSSLTPGSELAIVQRQTREAEQALSVLDDAAADVAGGIQRMLEIPHITGGRLTGVSLTRYNNWLRTSGLADSEIGRVMRSVFQTLPRRFGARIVLEIEDAEVVRDFERAMLRSQVVLTPEEVSLAKQGFANAIKRSNPTREMDFKRIVSELNAKILDRIDTRYGVDAAMRKLIKTRLGRRFGGLDAGDRQTFAAFAGTEAQRIQARGLRRTLARSNLGAEDRAALESAIRDLEHGTGAADVTEIGKPFLASQFDNTAEMIDPVLYRLGIAETMGTWRKWLNAQSSALGGIPQFTGKAIIPARAAADRIAETLIQDLFLAIWKPLAVLRPAYVLRVVGLEEQSRFLATVGIFNRLAAGKRSGPLLERLGLSKPVQIKVGFKLPEGVGQRVGKGNVATVEDSILFLNDRAAHGIIDGVGFTAEHRDEAEALAQVILHGGIWDDLMRQRALEIASAYPTQLASVGIVATKLKIRGDAATTAAAALGRQRLIDDGVMTFRRTGVGPEPLVNAGRGAAHLLLDSSSAVAKELASLRPGRWLRIARDEDHFDDFWWNALVHQYGMDPMGNRILLGVAAERDPERLIGEIMTWLRDTRGEGPTYARRLLHGVDDITDEALEYQVRIAVRYADDITAGHPEFAAAAARNELDPSVLRTIPPAEKPLYVHGPEMAELFSGQIGGLKKFRDFFGRWILQEPTNRLSRQPYFRHWYDLTYRSLVENAKASGWAPDAIKAALPGFRETARQQGIAQVRRIMFDFSRTGRVEEMTRYGLVFVQPFLEFPLVWSRIIRQRPEVIGHAIRLGRNAMESGFVRRDEETGELVIPLSWWAGAAPLLAMATGGALKPGAGGGWELSANLSAFNLFAQGAFPVNLGGFAGTEFPIPIPSIAPPLQGVMQNWLASSTIDARLKSRIESWLFQFGEISVTQPQGLLPSWLRHGLEAAFPELLADSANLNRTHFLQLQEAMGLEPDPELAANQAWKFSTLRMFFAWVFPAAPKIEFPTVDLENEYRDLIETYGPLEGREKFLIDHPENRLITIARTMWDATDPDDPFRSPLPIPANRLVAELLATKGAREFAQRYPEWVWAIIPNELAEGKFDPGIFFAQIASGARAVRSPGEFIAEGQRQAGWDGYFDLDEDYRASFATLEDQGLGEGDPGWDDLAGERDDELQRLRGLYPAWWTDYKTQQDEGVSPRVLGVARELARNKMFGRTEVGRWLQGFLPLYDRTRDALAEANLRTLSSTTAERLGIVKMWEDGLKVLGGVFPQGEQAFRLFFDDALRADVRTVGDRLIDGISESTFDKDINPWWSTFETRRAAIDVAGPEEELSAAYAAVRTWVNSSYDAFPADENPMILWWGTRNPTEKESYLVSLVRRAYQYNSRFDRETILGESTSPAAEEAWGTYEQIRLFISQQEASDPAFSSTRAYAALDVWVRSQTAADPAFAEQVAHANTWGFAFEQVLDRRDDTWGFLGSAEARPSWDALLDAVRQVQVVVEAYDLHGLSDTAAKAIAYRALRDSLMAHVDELSQVSPEFAAEWNWLDRQTGPEAAIEVFMPPIWYRIGGSEAVAA